MSVGNPAANDLVLGRLLRAAAEHHGDRTFLQFGALTRSFGEVDRLTNSVANGLAALGVERGSKIGIMAPNGPAFVDAWLGAIKLGAVYVPINTDYRGDILRYQLDKADITHLVIDPAFLERLDAVLDDAPKLRHVVLTASDPSRLRLLHGDVEVSALANVMQAPDRAPAIDVGPFDPMAISFTSGTTGPSKGVLASH
jgi:carnitine-CoA ligase